MESLPKVLYRIGVGGKFLFCNLGESTESKQWQWKATDTPRIAGMTPVRVLHSKKQHRTGPFSKVMMSNSTVRLNSAWCGVWPKGVSQRHDTWHNRASYQSQQNCYSPQFYVGGCFNERQLTHLIGALAVSEPCNVSDVLGISPWRLDRKNRTGNKKGGENRITRPTTPPHPISNALGGHRRDESSLAVA